MWFRPLNYSQVLRQTIVALSVPDDDAPAALLRTVTLAVAVAVLSLAATASPALAQQPSPGPTISRVAETVPLKTDTERLAYRLGPDDQIVIQVPNAPDLNGKSQRIDPTGDIRLPMVGRIQAGGMTVEALEAELTTRLKEFLHEPDVSISVTEFKSQPVSVIGAVGASGVRQLEGRKTLIEMLSLAGGVTVDAGPIVRVARRLDQGAVPLPAAAPDPTGAFTIVDIDLRALLEARSPELNIVILPHDVISIPRAERVFVVGEVGRAGPVTITVGNSISVLEAVSSSGGVLRTAASGKARILRQRGGDETRTEVSVDLKKIMHGTAKDVPMIAGDILVIPDSKSKRAGARAIEAAIQAGLVIGTYGIAR